jgi:hypothetical protein
MNLIDDRHIVRFDQQVLRILHKRHGVARTPLHESTPAPFTDR